jgi:hypothetical protein
MGEECVLVPTLQPSWVAKNLRREKFSSNINGLVAQVWHELIH